MIGLGTATAQLDTSVNIAFPAITRGFALDIGDIQWVVICYVLTYASLLLALGRIGDTRPWTVYWAGLICSGGVVLSAASQPRRDAGFRRLQDRRCAGMSCGAALRHLSWRRWQPRSAFTMMMALADAGPLAVP